MMPRIGTIMSNGYGYSAKNGMAQMDITSLDIKGELHFSIYFVYFSLSK
jgi:hypothetical protein